MIDILINSQLNNGLGLIFLTIFYSKTEKEREATVQGDRRPGRGASLQEQGGAQAARGASNPEAGRHAAQDFRVGEEGAGGGEEIKSCCSNLCLCFFVEFMRWIVVE